MNNGDGTVTDTKTGPMLQQAPDDRPGSMRNWADAVAYCDTLVLGGHDDWRLPTLYELVAIVDTSREPTINPVFSYGRGPYWSSTIGDLTGDPAYAWFVSFLDGSSAPVHKSNGYYVRCVREGP